MRERNRFSAVTTYRQQRPGVRPNAYPGQDAADLADPEPRRFNRFSSPAPA